MADREMTPRPGHSTHSDEVRLTNKYRGAVLPFLFVESHAAPGRSRLSAWDEEERKLYREEARATKRPRPAPPPPPPPLVDEAQATRLSCPGTAAAVAQQRRRTQSSYPQHDAAAGAKDGGAEARNNITTAAPKLVVGQPPSSCPPAVVQQTIPQRCGAEVAVVSSSVPLEPKPRLEKGSPRAQLVQDMPWQRFRPSSSAEIYGQDGAKAQASKWFASGKTRVRGKATLFASALVLQGPSGCGKSCLARCLIVEAGYAVVEFGPHTEVPLPQFLRNLGAVDCEGRKNCLLVDDLPQVMEQKANTGAETARVHCPVVCTADFVVKRTHSQYSCVVSMFALRPSDLRLILSRRLAPALGLSQADQARLLEGARGDARQLCVQASFTSQLTASTSLRDAALSPWDHARALLGGRSEREATQAAQEDISHQSYCLLQENFCATPGLSIDAAAGFAADMSLMDVMDAECDWDPGTLAGRSCLRWRGSRAFGRARLTEYGGWAADKKRTAARAALLRERDARYVVGVSLSQLATQTYGV